MQLNVLGNSLDKQQTKAALYNKKNAIIIAGAGSGKSLTMVGKIKYLVMYQNVNLEDILCITFTNDAATSLANKIKQELNQDSKVWTFHKLSLEILKNNNITYSIAEDDLLEFIVHELLICLNNYKFIKKYIGSLLDYQNVIIRFIKLFISNYYEISYFDTIIKQARKTDQILLKIIKKIYELYIIEKNASQLIDFDDMIYLATNIVKNNGVVHNYKYIIIDEYQDTSRIRENLVKEIIKRTNALITVVGDDFQSIYRFSGCDINNFLDFTKRFKPAKKLYLTNTYRNSLELIKVAGKFVMKNKRQIYKNLSSKKHIAKPIVILFYKRKETALTKALKYINKEKLMILGRNNTDPNVYNLKIQNNNIYYKTIHKSKGLEEDNVLIINLTSNINSLPSQIKEENIMQYVLIHKDKYPFEEERRLFYVALTRTKNYCYLLVPQKNSSIFIEELIKDYKNYIEFVNL